MGIYREHAVRIVNEVPCFEEASDYSKNYDEIASTLIEGLKKNNENPWMQDELWKQSEIDTVNLCNSFVKPAMNILDVGCGTGRLLGYFNDVNKYGIDISVDMARMCRDNGIEACMGNVQRLPYKTESMDIVLCTDVLEHVFDLHQTLAEIVRVTKPGGHIVLRVPQNEDLSPYLEPDYPFEYVHLRMFSKSSLRIYCEKVFKLKCLDILDTYKVITKDDYRRIFILRRISKAILDLLIRLNPKVQGNEKVCNIFRIREFRYIDVAELFEK